MCRSFSERCVSPRALFLPAGLPCQLVCCACCRAVCSAPGCISQRRGCHFFTGVCRLLFGTIKRSFLNLSNQRGWFFLPCKRGHLLTSHKGEGPVSRKMCLCVFTCACTHAQGVLLNLLVLKFLGNSKVLNLNFC